MKLGIMSDSHDNLPNIRRALEVFRAAGASAVIHAGDYGAPFAVREVLKFGGETYGVFGNNDGERDGIRKLWNQVHNPPHLFILGGRRIVVMHDLIPPENLPADMAGAEVFVYGHTHRAAISREAGGALFINPGETGGWLTGEPTVAVLDTETMQAEILKL